MNGSELSYQYRMDWFIFIVKIFSDPLRNTKFILYKIFYLMVVKITV